MLIIKSYLVKYEAYLDKKEYKSPFKAVSRGYFILRGQNTVKAGKSQLKIVPRVSCPVTRGSYWLSHGAKKILNKLGNLI